MTWKYKEQNPKMQEVLTAFSNEVKRICMTEGIEWVIRKCQKDVTEEEILDVSAGNFAPHLTGVAQDDKDFINKFGNLFTKEQENNHLWHDVLWELMPLAMRALSKDLNDSAEYKKKPDGSKVSWSSMAKDSGIIRNSLYSYAKGVVYPGKETIIKLGKIISPETQRILAQELLGVKLSLDALKPSEVTPFIPEWTAEEKEFLLSTLLMDLDEKTKIRVATDIMIQYVRNLSP